MKHTYYTSPKIACFGFVFLIALAFGYETPAQTRDYSIDLADVLSIADEAKLDEMARKLEEKTNVQFLFYTIDNLGGRAIEEVSLEAAQKLGVGAKGLNSGLVLMFAIKDRKMRLEVGYGMEWHIPNEKAAKVLEALVPFLQKNDFYNAFVKGFSEVKTLLGKDNWFLDNRRYSLILEEGEKSVGVIAKNDLEEVVEKGEDYVVLKFRYSKAPIRLHYTTYQKKLVENLTREDDLYFRFKSLNPLEAYLLGVVK